MPIVPLSYFAEALLVMKPSMLSIDHQKPKSDEKLTSIQKRKRMVENCEESSPTKKFKDDKKKKLDGVNLIFNEQLSSTVSSCYCRIPFIEISRQVGFYVWLW